MNDLDELFNRDPLGLTDQDIDKIIASVRAQLAQFDLTGKSPSRAKPKAKKSLDEKAKPAPAQIDLADIGLE